MPSFRMHKITVVINNLHITLVINKLHTFQCYQQPPNNINIILNFAIAN